MDKDLFLLKQQQLFCSKVFFLTLCIKFSIDLKDKVIVSLLAIRIKFLFSKYPYTFTSPLERTPRCNSKFFREVV